MAEHYRNGPDQSVERPGIGRRHPSVKSIRQSSHSWAGSTGHDRRAAGLLICLSRRITSERYRFLREQVMHETTGCTQFVASCQQLLDIVQRELALGQVAAHHECSGLQALLNSGDEDLIELRWQLVRGLRDKRIALDAPVWQRICESVLLIRFILTSPAIRGLQPRCAAEKV